jgi:hypothetical protein
MFSALFSATAALHNPITPVVPLIRSQPFRNCKHQGCSRSCDRSGGVAGYA